MAEITTIKRLVTVGEKPEQKMQVGVEPGCVKILIDSELVAHCAAMGPQEAVQMGVALIQLGGQAQAMAQHIQAEERANKNGAQGMPANFKPFKV